MSVAMDPAAICRRLRQAAAATDLRTERRLDAKLDMTPEGIEARLRQVEMLRRTCLALGALRRVDDAPAG